MSYTISAPMPATGTVYKLSNVSVSGTASATMTMSSTGSIGWTDPAYQAAIVISSDTGDIYRGRKRDGLGVFERLEKLERMLGILSRQRSLEESYPPLKQTGEEYERVCERAIASIIDVAAKELGDLRDRYEAEVDQARIYVELSRE